MDESWRMIMGGGRRRSTEQNTTTRISTHHVFDLSYNTPSISNSEALDPEDFKDVFGGPPLTVLSRKTSTSNEFNVSDIFRSPETFNPANKVDTVPGFGVPVTESGGRRRGITLRSEGFYDDIFGSDHEDGKSRSKDSLRSKSITKSNSSSVLSSEDLSPLRPSVSDDLFFSSQSSRLRPINIPLQRKSPPMVLDEQKNMLGKSDTPHWLRPQFTKACSSESSFNKNYSISSHKISQSGSSPEIVNIEPTSYRRTKSPMDDIESESPSPTVSSLWNRAPDDKATFEDMSLLEEEEEEDDEEIMSSYVIELGCEKNKSTSDESMTAIDEAVAWAKEKFQTEGVVTVGGGARIPKASPSSTKQFPGRQAGGFVTRENCYQLQDGHERLQFLMVNEKLRNWMTEEKQQ